jgi:hypothetical protein
MKTFICRYKLTLFFILCSTLIQAQNDTVVLKRQFIDTTAQKLNMDAVYNRPFLKYGKVPIAIGGYAEANTQYISEGGVAEGLSFQMRRFTIFLSSTIAKKIKFFTELEFEDGSKEINLEYAAMDIEFHPLLNLRGGIILNPIGSFNQNHDGPRWDFIDRPLSSTTIIPSTLSNVGFGIHGRYFTKNLIVGYEAYLTNGFDDNIISNPLNRTALSEGKLGEDRFEESNNGSPMLTTKIALRNRKIGEIGISYLTGAYNKYLEDGLLIDIKRNASILAFDFNTSLLYNKINITGEIAKVVVELPLNYLVSYGSEQVGGFVDVVGTVFHNNILGWENAKINVSGRVEYVDYNQDIFKETNNNISDHLLAITGGLVLRPVGSSVLRFNYKHQKQTDLLGNPPVAIGIIQFGFSTYF